MKQDIQEILAKKVLSLAENDRLLAELNMVIQGYNDLKDKEEECNCQISKIIGYQLICLEKDGWKNSRLKP